MADNYLEKQYEAYQVRKAAWEKERKYGKKPSPMKRPKTLENQKRVKKHPLLVPIWKILFECWSRQMHTCHRQAIVFGVLKEIFT